MEEKKKPMCFRCVHLHPAEVRASGTEITIYKCLMVQTEITEEHYAVDCNQFYTPNMDG